MISGNDYAGLNKCGYLDGNFQNAKDMMLNCVGDKEKGERGLCTSDYKKLYDNIAFNSQFINIKRGMNAGFSIRPYNSEIIKDTQISDVSASTVEGFTNYSGVKEFVVPPGPGETNVEERCSQGYTWDGSKCVQVCTNCKYKDKMKSQSFNEYDKCFPEGVYNGVDEKGYRRCTCGENNQFCSDKFLNNYSAGGLEMDIKKFSLSELFNIKNL